jgi:Heterokaryon incompatibility protein (HET)
MENRFYEGSLTNDTYATQSQTSTPDPSEVGDAPVTQAISLLNPQSSLLLQSLPAPEMNDEAIQSTQEFILEVDDVDELQNAPANEDDQLPIAQPGIIQTSSQSTQPISSRVYQPSEASEHGDAEDSHTHEEIPLLSALTSASALLPTGCGINTAMSPGPSRSPSAASVEDLPLPKQSPLYASLPLSKSGMIRVYDLQDTADPDDRIIKGLLRIINLAENPSFTALSYCWGSYSSPKDTISCGEHSLEITRNCWSALWHLRKKFGSITIWVDGICINQDDGDEKSIQIPLMRDIYSSAQIVYLWLGEGNKKTDQAMDYLAKGGLPFQLGITAKIHKEIATGNSMSWRLGLHLWSRMITFRYRTHFDGLEDIFSRAWIHRLWTLQEVLLARNPLLICGVKTASWQGLVYSLELMQFFGEKPACVSFPYQYRQWWRLWAFRSDLSHQLSTRDDMRMRLDYSDAEPSESDIKMHKHFLQRGWQIFVLLSGLQAALGLLWIILAIPVAAIEVDHRVPSYIVLPSFFLGAIFLYLPSICVVSSFYNRQAVNVYPLSVQEAILMQLVERQTTKSRDRYYGVLGLISAESQPQMMPDYSLSIERTYRRLFLELLRWTRSLDILLYISCKKFHRAPSWVFDWRSTNNDWVLIRFFKSNTRWARYLSTYAEKYDRFKGATSGSESSWTIRGRKSQLVVHGLTIGQVSWCSELLPQDDKWPDSEQLLQSVRDFQAAIDGLELARLEEIMNQLCVMASSYSPADPRAASSKKNWSKILHQSMRHSPEWALEQLKNSKWRSFFRFKSAWRYHAKLTNYMKTSRRVLIRCSGDYSGFGITCNCVRPGDTVVLISGMSLPMILREQGDGFKVVGPALLGGIMNGELWKDHESDSLEKLTLV